MVDAVHTVIINRKYGPLGLPRTDLTNPTHEVHKEHMHPPTRTTSPLALGAASQLGAACAGTNREALGTAAHSC